MPEADFRSGPIDHQLRLDHHLDPPSGTFDRDARLAWGTQRAVGQRALNSARNDVAMARAYLTGYCAGGGSLPDSAIADSTVGGNAAKEFTEAPGTVPQ
ncbi:MAG TPA: hypothetical protein EYP14_06980 [Planctomycetaceae bacterium]|nr:hypothetical protein [Planctomycetaceae bacterium]